MLPPAVGLGPRDATSANVVGKLGPPSHCGAARGPSPWGVWGARPPRGCMDAAHTRSDATASNPFLAASSRTLAVWPRRFLIRQRQSRGHRGRSESSGAVGKNTGRKALRAAAVRGGECEPRHFGHDRKKVVWLAAPRLQTRGPAPRAEDRSAQTARAGPSAWRVAFQDHSTMLLTSPSPPMLNPMSQRVREKPAFHWVQRGQSVRQGLP
jgi:hypothetical protein